MAFKHPFKPGDHVRLRPDILKRPVSGPPGSEWHELYKRVLGHSGIVIHTFETSPHTQVRFNIPSRWRQGEPGYRGTLGLHCDELVGTGEYTPPPEEE